MGVADSYGDGGTRHETRFRSTPGTVRLRCSPRPAASVRRPRRSGTRTETRSALRPTTAATRAGRFARPSRGSPSSTARSPTRAATTPTTGSRRIATSRSRWAIASTRANAAASSSRSTAGATCASAPDTDLAVLNLTDDTKQFAVKSGVASVRIRRLDRGRGLRSGHAERRDHARAAGRLPRGHRRGRKHARHRARKGARTSRPAAASISLGDDEALQIWGTDSPQYDTVAMRAPDGWDRWVEERESRIAHARSDQYVSDDIAGVDDLDEYGRWDNIPNYGSVWTPTAVAVGLGAVPRGPVDLAGPVGLDLGLDRAVGLGALPLRPLGLLVVALVLGARRAPRALRDLQSGARGLRRRRARLVAVGHDLDGRLRRLVPARSARSRSFPGGGRGVNVHVTNVTYVNRTYVTVVNQTTFVSGRVVVNNIVRDRTVIRQVETAPILRGPLPFVPDARTRSASPGGPPPPSWSGRRPPSSRGRSWRASRPRRRLRPSIGRSP